LEHIKILRQKGFTDIKAILTSREDLEDEAKHLVRNDPDKVYKHFLKSSGIPGEDLSKVRCKMNPLLELLNFIWLIRGVPADETFQSMTDYLEGKKSQGAKKYRRDYVDKYKLSLMFLLCSIYKKEKQYYSFNTFAFLSSGIVGHFIELCRRSFAIAEWSDADSLLEEGKISEQNQTRAAMDFSIAEKQQINRIEEYGGKISRFVENIGNIFRRFHSDHLIRYPEVNQFAINIDAIHNSQLRGALTSAIKWSVIQKKRKMHRSAPNEPFQDTYALNRIFSPIFQISYRTRGGKSVRLNEQQLFHLMSDMQIKLSDYAPEGTLTNEDAEATLFSQL
jgi:hypothetical protein